MTKGIHHITAIASNAKTTLHFYTAVLGLRLVKKTVNQDDVTTYHLFFGDNEGHPGMDLTFFIFKPVVKGARGNGLVTTISLAVPESSLPFWQKRFKAMNVKHQEINERFGKKRILFFDPDDQQLELVGVPEKELESSPHTWTKIVEEKYAIRSFYSATLSTHNIKTLEPLLTSIFGYAQVAREKTVIFYKITGFERAAFIEVDVDPDRDFGINANGTVHHIAFRADDIEEQRKMRLRVITLGIPTTDVVDRYYFKSVYFRTHSGILFEIATDDPGFTADETVEELGRKLALPPIFEDAREIIESNLEPLETNE